VPTRKPPKPSIKNFTRSFRSQVSGLKPGEQCGWKKHFRFAAREVVGFLQLLAGNNPDGFIFASVPEIVKGCLYSKPKQREVEDILRWLRDRGIISDGFDDLFKQHDGRRGFIGPTQAIHDVLCERDKSICRFIGWDSVGPVVKLGEHFPDSVVFASESDLKSAAQSAVLRDDAVSNSAVLSAVQSAVPTENKCGSQCGTESPQPQETSEVVSSSEKFSRSFPAPNLLTSNLFIPEERRIDQPGSLSNDPNEAGQNQNHPSSSLSLSRNEEVKSRSHELEAKPETFGGHFLMAPASSQEDLIMIVTDGEFPSGDWIRNYPHWLELLECCNEIITKMANYNFVGRKSCADVMDAAMKLQSRRHKNNAPKPWLPVLRKLYGTPGPCLYDPTEDDKRREQRAVDWDKWMPKKFQKKTKVNMVAWNRGGQFLVDAAGRAGILIQPPYPEAITKAPPLNSNSEAFNYLCSTTDPLSDPLDKLRGWLFAN
jgi:hypothetical protein